MSSLRAEQQIAVAARAAQRVADKQARVAEMYAGKDSPLTVSVEELNEEMQQAGHAYDERCQRPTCVKVRQMLGMAMSQVLSQGQGNG